MASAIIHPSGRRIQVAENDAVRSDATGSTFPKSPQYAGEPDNDRIDSSNMLEYIATAIGGLETLGVEGAVSLASRVRNMIESVGIGSGDAAATNKSITNATEHGMARALGRGISDEQVQEAIRSAEVSGSVTTQIGKYGTPQKVYNGTNGITVVVETAGRNAGKVITAWSK